MRVICCWGFCRTGSKAWPRWSITSSLTGWPRSGAFGVVSIVEGRAGGDRLSDFAGLSRRAPVLSFCMLIFMLSLAGIPPLAGFFGKFYVFASALNADPSNLGLLWLVVVALAMSAVSLYYYLQVLKQIYIAEPGPGTGAAADADLQPGRRCPAGAGGRGAGLRAQSAAWPVAQCDSCRRLLAG